MPKLKTHKTLLKRVRVTKNKKVLIRHGGQGHFNSRDTGNQTRLKRNDKEISDSLKKTILQNLPYNN